MDRFNILSKLCPNITRCSYRDTGVNVVIKTNPEPNEMDFVANLTPHDNIVSFDQIFRERNQRSFIVMEYCAGGDLCTYIQERGRLETPDAVQKFREIVLAVSHVHDLGYVHRDLSVDNILLTTDGTCKLCDFGAVQSIDAQDDQVVGKISYMAPEVSS